jgi:hypothetical protein
VPSAISHQPSAISHQPSAISHQPSGSSMTIIKSVLLATFAIILTTYSSAPAFATKEAIKHIDLPDITSYEEAKEVLSQTTAELLKKNKLDETELHEIHMITYSLEKAVAYLSENIKDDQQASAKEMARLVELVHVSAENNRATETEVYLREYFELANTYSERR